MGIPGKLSLNPSSHGSLRETSVYRHVMYKVYIFAYPAINAKGPVMPRSSLFHHPMSCRMPNATTLSRDLTVCRRVSSGELLLFTPPIKSRPLVPLLQGNQPDRKSTKTPCHVPSFPCGTHPPYILHQTKAKITIMNQSRSENIKYRRLSICAQYLAEYRAAPGE
jgi:hypothetical protein